ncbi:MAG: BGTF surface domain-containing protein [Halorientalis sp.]
MTGTRSKIRSLFLATLMVTSVFAGFIAFSGSAAAAANNIDYPLDQDPTEQKSNHYDVKLTSSAGPYWQGQRLVIEVKPDSVTSNDVVQIREANSHDGGGQRVGSLVQEVSLNSDDEAIINTADLEGSYVITTGASEDDVLYFSNGRTADADPADNSGSNNFADDGSVVSNPDNVYQAVATASFEVTPQNLNVGFKSAEAAQEEVYIEADSARTNYDMLVKASGLDDEELVDILEEEVSEEPGSGTEDDDDGSVVDVFDASNASADDGDNGGDLAKSNFGDGVVLEGVSGNANITANFSGIETGDYEFTFEVTDTGATDTSTISVTEQDNVNAEILRGGVATAAQADFAVIPIRLQETDHATVNVGFNNVNFNATFRVNDGNNDGIVVVNMNTFIAGRNDESSLPAYITNEIPGWSDGAAENTQANLTLSAALSADDNEDSVTITPGDPTDDLGMVVGPSETDGNGLDSNVGIDGPMEPDQYDVNVTYKGSELDVGTIQIVKPQVVGINSWTMPGEKFSAVEEDETAEIYEYVNAGELTKDNSIAKGDVLVYQIRSTSMFGALKFVQATDSSSYASALNTISDPGTTANFKFRVQQTEGTTQANQQEKVLDLGDSVNNGVKVVPDERNSSLFVVMQVGNLQLARDSDFADGTVDGQANLNMKAGEAYVANWTTFDASDIGSSTQSVTDKASIVEQSINFDTGTGDVIRVNAATGQVISGTTTVAPGTELNIRLRSTGDSPFLEDQSTVVTQNGTFSVTFDLSDRAQNASFVANAQGFDSEYATPGVIGQAPTADVTFENQTVQNGMVSVQATLSQGGFVSIRSGSPSGDIVGTSGYLEPGTSTVQIDVGTVSSETTLYAVAHMDTNGNQALDFPGADGPYTLNGSAVSDSAVISPPAQGPTDTETQTEQQTEQQTQQQTEQQTQQQTEQQTQAAQTTTEGGPGFTAVLALVALVAAALLAVRRRD